MPIEVGNGLDWRKLVLCDRILPVWAMGCVMVIQENAIVVHLVASYRHFLRRQLYRVERWLDSVAERFPDDQGA